MCFVLCEDGKTFCVRMKINVLFCFLVMKNVRDGGSVFDNPYSYRKAPSDENSGGNDESKSDLENKES